MQSNRLFEIIYILLNRKSVTARELSERFEISQRTVYRDIDTLSLAGIPVYTEKGKGGGISLLPGFVLNKSLLSETEQNEILAALRGLASVSSAETGELLDKLSAVFNKSAANWLDVDFSDWGNSGSEVFLTLKAAILERRIVSFDYFGTAGDATRRCVEPLQLWFKSRSWYVKCFCLLRQDVRLFKLTRIRNITLTGTHFDERDLLAARPAPVSPDRAAKCDVRLKLRIAPAMAYRAYDEFGDAMTELPGGGCLVDITWPEDDWVYGTILSFGEHIEVLEPAYLRDIIRKKAQKIAEIYS